MNFIIPAQSQFSYQEQDLMWFSKGTEDQDIDLEIVATDSQDVFLEHYAILKKIEPVFSLLVKTASDFVSKFCLVNCDEVVCVVCLSLGKEKNMYQKRLEYVLKVYFVYEEDTYGLWSVEFKEFATSPLGFWPYAFKREST